MPSCSPNFLNRSPSDNLREKAVEVNEGDLTRGRSVKMWRLDKQCLNKSPTQPHLVGKMVNYVAKCLQMIRCMMYELSRLLRTFKIICT